MADLNFGKQFVFFVEWIIVFQKSSLYKNAISKVTTLTIYMLQCRFQREQIPFKDYLGRWVLNTVVKMHIGTPPAPIGVVASSFLAPIPSQGAETYPARYPVVAHVLRFLLHCMSCMLGSCEWLRFWLLSLTWPWPYCCRHTGSESAERRFSFSCLSATLCFSHK